MKLRIEPKHFKDANYASNEDCPIARALKSAGYFKVHVGGFTLGFTKRGATSETRYTIQESIEVPKRIYRAILQKRPRAMIVNLKKIV